LEKVKSKISSYSLKVPNIPWYPKKQQKRYKRKTTTTELMNNHNDDGLYGVENVRRGEYSLMESKRSHGLSPIGGLARLLMANLISKGNKLGIRRHFI
jgi:hypothetical protein